jgi:hypothetical protein
MSLSQNWSAAMMGAVRAAIARCGSSAAWIPYEVDGETGVVDIPHVPLEGICVRADDGGATAPMYRVVGVLGSGTHGVVFHAVRMDPHTMAELPDGDVALKFMLVDERRQPPDDGEDVFLEQFARYMLQRAYGGCVASVVCVRDAFVYRTAPGGRVYAVVATDKMDGDVRALLASRDLSEMPARRRFEAMLVVACMMARAVYDLELQCTFHDDIKLANFLYVRRGMDPGDLEIKITDFDLSAFSTRMNGGDGRRLPHVCSSVLPRLGHPGIRYMLHSGLAARSHEPPEYAIVREAAPDGGAACVFNAEWLSRMMAFELLGAVGEMFAAVRLELPLADDAVRAKDILDGLVRDVTVETAKFAMQEIGGQCLCVPSEPSAEALARYRPTTAQLLGRLVRLAMSVGALPRRNLPGLTSAVPIAEHAALGYVCTTGADAARARM